VANLPCVLLNDELNKGLINRKVPKERVVPFQRWQLGLINCFVIVDDD